MAYQDLADAVAGLVPAINTLTNQAAQALANANAALDESAGQIAGKVDLSGLSSAVDPVGGAGSVGFSYSTAYAPGTLGARLKSTLSVTDKPFNAASGQASSTAAFQAAYDAAAAGGKIIIPGPGPYTVGAIIGTKQVTWEIQFDPSNNLGLLALPGIVQCRIGSALTTYRSKGQGADFASIRSTRIADYAGGTPGNVCSNFFATTSVPNNQADSFEWVGTFVLENSGTGQNVAVYGQANRRANSAITRGGTFAACFEARDFTLEANPTSGLIGVEVDVFANGKDTVGRRVGIDLVIGKGVASGDACEVYAGLRFGPAHGDNTVARFRNAILIDGDKDYGMQIAGTGVETAINIYSTGGKIGVRVAGGNTDSDFVSEGTSVYGLRLSGTYSSGVSIRLGANSAIALESTAAIRLRYDNLAVRFTNANVEKFAISTATGALSIAGTQVVGPRASGWAPMTGTANSGTAYDVSTVTLAQLAARVAALQKALTDNHGLIGI